jgi:hypothetical protein
VTKLFKKLNKYLRIKISINNKYLNVSQGKVATKQSIIKFFKKRDDILKK